MDFLLAFGAFILLICLAIPVLGKYMANVFLDKRHPGKKLFGWLEEFIYKICGINPEKEMTATEYLKAMVAFNGLCLLFLFLILISQSWLPLNPAGQTGVPLDLAFHTSSSFVTSTNWQSYAGETTLSYFSQMVGLTPMNFLSAAVGLAVMMAFIRGLYRERMQTLGNFWSDLTRALLYILLPLSILLSVFLISQGSIQNFKPYVQAKTVEGAEQVIPMGPVASQVAIKQLGTNGGGFFAANSSHPFENPTYWSNFFECFAIILIPAASVYTFGLLIGRKREGWVILLVIALLASINLASALYFESRPNEYLGTRRVMEGREQRIGSFQSVFWAICTTGTSNGSVNNMFSSLSPIAGGVALMQMMMEEVILGGVGVGLAKMLLFVLLTVFLAGLMVGRSPEYLGKKVEQYEIKWVMLAIVTPSTLILLGVTVALMYPEALSSLSTKGPHALTELLYAFTSAAANNGSAFAGINTNTPFYNLILGSIMLMARMATLVPCIFIAGSMVKKAKAPRSLGTFSTDSGAFGILLFSVLLILTALTFFPALCLGPIVEQILLLQGKGF